MEAKTWHRLSEDKMGPEVARIVGGYQSDQQGRRGRYLRNTRYFEEAELASYSAYAYASDYSSDDVFEPDRLGLVRSAVAHVVSDIYAPQKPKPQFQTLGATWNMRRRAYRLDRIVEAILNQRQGRFINVWAFMIDAATDCALQGDTLVGVTADLTQKRIAHELIQTPDVFFDPAEGRFPMNGFRIGPIDQETAMLRFVESAAPGDKARIEQAIRGAPPYKWFGNKDSLKERDVEVKQIQYAYRLPDGPDNPGKAAIVIGNETVEVTDWTAPAFPWVQLQWEPHREGPWASGIADEGGKLAREAGEFDYRLHRRIVIAAGKRIWVPTGAEIKDQDLERNDEVNIIRYSGALAPTETVVPGVTEAEIDLRERKIRNFWDKIGLSQISAAARREANLTSGLAQLTLNQTKQGRQLVKAQRYEQAYVDLAHQYVWRLRELEEAYPGYKVTWPGKGSLLRELSFKGADVDDDMFHVIVAPASMLARDPAGRQQQVQELFQANLISQATARQLIQFPDLDAELLMQQSEPDYVDMLIERYLDAKETKFSEEDYEAPEGFIFDKRGALRRFASAYFRARIEQNTLPKKEKQKVEFPLKLLSNYIKQLDVLISGGEAIAQGGGGPSANPAVPPDQVPAGSAGEIDQLAQPAQRPAA